MENPGTQFLMQVCELLMRNGIKSMTMDDISRGLGISKKTLYRHFKDKGDLVFKALDNYLEEDKKTLDDITLKGYNAIEEMFEITRHISGQIKDIHPSIHYDLEKYYPEAWQLFLNYKMNYVYESVKANMAKGIKEGLYRGNLHISIVAKIYIARIDIVFDPQVFPTTEFRFVDVLHEMIRYHIRGISSEKGIKYMEVKFKNTDPELL